MRFSLCLAIALTACGGGTSKVSTSSTEPAAACEPGRCLEDISKLISERRTESRACYDEGAKKMPGMKGRIIINFRIDAEGNVEDSSQGMQDDQIQDEALVSCVSEVIKKVTFAASSKGKTTRAYHQFEFGK